MIIYLLIFFLFVYLTAFITSTSINGKGQFQDVGDYFEYYKRQLAIYAIFFCKIGCFTERGGGGGGGYSSDTNMP